MSSGGSQITSGQGSASHQVASKPQAAVPHVCLNHERGIPGPNHVECVIAFPSSFFQCEISICASDSSTTCILSSTDANSSSFSEGLPRDLMSRRRPQTKVQFCGTRNSVQDSAVSRGSRTRTLSIWVNPSFASTVKMHFRTEQP